jgi:hypothetical protein
MNFTPVRVWRHLRVSGPARIVSIPVVSVGVPLCCDDDEDEDEEEDEEVEGGVEDDEPLNFDLKRPLILRGFFTPKVILLLLGGSGGCTVDEEVEDAGVGGAIDCDGFSSFFFTIVVTP